MRQLVARIERQRNPGALIPAFRCAPCGLRSLLRDALKPHPEEAASFDSHPHPEEPAKRASRRKRVTAQDESGRLEGEA
jgi:hypothetical protein